VESTFLVLLPSCNFIVNKQIMKILFSGNLSLIRRVKINPNKVASYLILTFAPLKKSRNDQCK
jgi:hypothetical protein